MTTERSEYTSALTAAVAQYRTTVLADERVVGASKRWSACIREAGFDYDTPQELRDAFFVRANSGLTQSELESLRREEIAAAEANVPCEDAYRATFRDVVVDRFSEFKVALAAAVDGGTDPGAQG